EAINQIGYDQLLRVQIIVEADDCLTELDIENHSHGLCENYQKVDAYFKEPVLDPTNAMIDISFFKQKLKEDSIRVTLAFDEWKNVLNQNIFGSLFILSTGEVQIWEAIDTSSERERIVNIIPKIENMIKNASTTTFESPLKITYDSSDEESNRSLKKLDELYLPQNITTILLNDSFWHSITRLHSLLLPY
ncbi:6471_t:CDS:2, partial [Gigaspora rosea]